MKHLFLKSCAAAVLCAGSLFAAPTTDFSRIQGGIALPVKPGEIKVDGILNEAAWQKSQVLTNFRRIFDRKPSDAKSAVRVAFDAKYLYIAWDLPGRPERLRATKNDSGEIFMDETIELFIGDPETPTAWRQLALTPGNMRFDSQDGDAYINMNWLSATKMNDKGWTAEMAIPWQDINIDPRKHRIIRINFCRSRHPFEAASMGKDPRDFYESASWSMLAKGYRELAGLGFLVLGDPAKAIAPKVVSIRRRLGKYAKRPEVTAILSKIACTSSREIVRLHELLGEAEQLLRKLDADSSASALSQRRQNRKALILSNWDESVELEAARDIQIPLLASLIRRPDPAKLQYKMAINEFAHRSFIISAIRNTQNITMDSTDLRSADGKVIPAKNVRFYRIGFLTPAKDLYPSYYNSWSKRPLPELVEEIDAPFALNKYVTTQIRVIVHTDRSAAGNYSGEITVKADGETIGKIPVNCRVLPIELVNYRDSKLWVYVFTGIPYGGRSGRAWAKLLREHYIAEVSMETPPFYLNGTRLRAPVHVKNSAKYIHDITHANWDTSGNLTVDGKFADYADRVRICAENNLRIIISNRGDDIWPEAFPAFRKFLQDNGFNPDNFIYKTGDEDTSLWQMPLVEKIHAIAPEQKLVIIPSGADYWDLSPLEKHYSYISFTRSGLSNPGFEKDIRRMQRNGVKMARYTNRTSWVERDVRLAGRDDLWDVLIRDKMDGYQIWTMTVTSAWLGYRYGYNGAKRTAVHNYPPEQQVPACLVYVRKQGDFYKPISCIRLEDMRDGITDYLYYRAAADALARRKDPRAAEKLQAISRMPRRTPADFAAIRERLIALILPEEK